MEKEKLYDDYFDDHHGPHHLWYVQHLARTPQRIALLRGPEYYDNPEGTDPVGKIWGINKFAILGALGSSIVDALTVSLVKTPLEYLNVLGYYMVPFVGCATTFASVVYLANDIRKVDDEKNYIFGAASCYPILHAWLKSTSSAIPGTIALIGAAVMKKYTHDHGDNALTLRRTFRKQQNTIENDFSWIKDEWPRRPIY